MPHISNSIAVGRAAVTPAGGEAAIRAAWAIYESNNGNSSTANGPVMDKVDSGYPYEAANVGFGIRMGRHASPYDAEVLLNDAATFSMGVFMQIGVTSFPGVYDRIFNLRSVTKNRSCNFTIRTDNNDDIVLYFATGTAGSGTLFNTALIPASRGTDWHLLSLSVDAGVSQLFCDGVAVGSTGTFAPATAATVPRIRLDCQQDIDTLTGQMIFATVPYTEAEWNYIYNSGAGRLYSTWEI